jgi:preprotein translocase subunit SecG
MSVFGIVFVLAITMHFMRKRREEKQEHERAQEHARNLHMHRPGFAGQPAGAHAHGVAGAPQQMPSEFEEEEPKKYRFRKLMLIVSWVLAAIAIILFIITQDMRSPMSFIDIWTLAHVGLLLLEIIAVVFVIRRRKKPEYETDYYQENQAYAYNN